MEYLPQFDVLVISSGHWFGKKSVYIVNNPITGGQLWRPKRIAPKMPINNVKALGISTGTALSAIAGHPNYSGLTIMRMLNGTVVAPALERLVLLVNWSGMDLLMQCMRSRLQVLIEQLRRSDGSRMRLMDITEAFGYRHDGHPGSYRNPDPNKATRRGPDGRPPPQDCLHWCMPGAGRYME